MNIADKKKGTHKHVILQATIEMLAGESDG